MSNYNIQYKEYYERLKKKHNTINLEQNFSQYDGIPIYRGNTIYTKNKKQKKESFSRNLITMQSVGAVILFLFAFGGKYSSNQYVREYYIKFKAGIEKQYTYANMKLNYKEINIDSIQDKLLESINWVKEKLLSDDFMY